MPIREYKCPNCGKFEHIELGSAPNLVRCPQCGKKVTLVLSSGSFILKGGCWAKDGYSNKPKT